MNCKICGSELKKPGEICNNCMAKILKEQEIKNDTQETYYFKKKFALGYQIIQHIDSILVAIIIVGALIWFSRDYLGIALIILAFFAIVGIIYLLNERRQMKNCKCILYKSKLVYITKPFLRKKEKVIGYNEIKEYSFLQSPVEKMFNIGRIVFSINTRNFLERNLIIESVKNPQEVFKKIKEILS